MLEVLQSLAARGIGEEGVYHNTRPAGDCLPYVVIFLVVL